MQTHTATLGDAVAAAAAQSPPPLSGANGTTQLWTPMLSIDAMKSALAEANNERAIDIEFWTLAPATGRDWAASLAVAAHYGDGARVQRWEHNARAIAAYGRGGNFTGACIMSRDARDEAAEDDDGVVVAAVTVLATAVDDRIGLILNAAGIE